MIAVGQVLHGVYPSFYTEGDARKDNEIRAELRRRQRLSPRETSPVEAVVEWIHPEGRFCVIRFEYKHPDRSFRECKLLKEGKR